MQMQSDPDRLVRGPLLAAAALFAATLFASVPGAHALSELREIPGQTQSDDDAHEAEVETGDPLQLPMPDPLIRRGGAVTVPQESDVTSDEPEAPAEVLYDIERAPEPVRRMRELIVEAAASGDIERLRPLLGKGMTQTQVSMVETDEEPVETLRSLSGDSEGIEVLAILLDVLATGFVHAGQGTGEELYIWPYFTEKPLASLSAPEKVELLRLVTAGDFAEMQEFGSYNFYRVGITPDGQWKFFVTGD